ncbi:class I SAM-dependent methyltransferase [Alkalibacillus almallahensis]|uniref:class I SAM-dependent methyltransferase n=1 Tax=Alkalibacillus almallahensis TaxID=1379154 RepID=UPI00141D97A2|nr:class I SAM-dependent methyltransferase [Alkalibacillus almallahensis]NIK11721.1 SAM-dependent methyltransferase [Alkalibacillus almallahensis]
MKQDNWVKPFYKNQFHMMKHLQTYSEYDEQAAKEIVDQTGKEFFTVLEIGSGNGNLARGLAEFNKDVMTVELVPELVEFAKENSHPNVTSLCGSFYDIKLPQTFDAVLYIDGFGIGEDADQLYLLKRIREWLTEDGIGLIDIYNPPYWRETAGKQMYIDSDGEVCRKYGYIHDTNHMTDTWWYTEAPEESFTQVLACYHVDEIKTMCELAGLEVIDVFSGGAMDWDEMTFNPKASLSACMSYRIKVAKSS